VSDDAGPDEAPPGSEPTAPGPSGTPGPADEPGLPQDAVPAAGTAPAGNAGETAPAAGTAPLGKAGEAGETVPVDAAGERKGPGWNHRGGGLYPPARAGFIEYDRVLFFSDAVFAIAITLLAVTLRVPDHAITNTGRVLHEALPSLTGFGISFAVIGLFWLGHHGIFRYITAFDRPLIALNLLFLGTIAFLPYPTELLSREPISNQPGVTVFYASCVSAAGLTELTIWLRATTPRSELSGAAAKRLRLPFALRIGRVPIVFGLSIPLALAAPAVAPYSWIAIWVIGIVANRMAPGTRRRAANATAPHERGQAG